MSAMWIAILIIGAFTYFTRALPFIWKSQLLEKASESAWLERLGPVMLVAMLVAVVLPFAQEAIELKEWLPLFLGISSVLVTLKIKPNAGLATIIGVLAYWVGLQF